MINRLLVISVLLTSLCKTTYALGGICIGYGFGEPDWLQGQRIALQKDLLFPLPFPYFRLQPYWDLSFARWNVIPPQIDQFRSVQIIALSPVLRLQFHGLSSLTTLTPFIELGIGPSFLSQSALGHRRFGSRFAFQDQIGFGLFLDKNQHFLISYHYVHYSNASLFPPNQGIDVKYFFSLGVQFS